MWKIPLLLEVPSCSLQFIYSLLIEKGICDRQNISTVSVFVCIFIQRYLHSLVRDFPFISYLLFYILMLVEKAGHTFYDLLYYSQFQQVVALDQDKRTRQQLFRPQIQTLSHCFCLQKQLLVLMYVLQVRIKLNWRHDKNCINQESSVNF